MKKNMLKILVFLLLFAVGSTTVRAQYGFGTNSPNPSAEVDVVSTNKGFLPPRMTSDQMAAIPNPAEGLVVYNTTVQCLMYYAKGAFTCTYGTPTPAPTASVVAVSGNVLLGRNLTATYTYNSGVAEGATRFRWYYSTDGTTSIPLSGATSNAYMVSAPVMAGNYLAVGVIPVSTAGTAGSQVVSPWRLVVANSAPYFNSFTASATGTTVSSIATASAVFYDPDGDASAAPLYQWYYCNSDGSNKIAISGANSATYTFTSGDAGKYITVGAQAVSTVAPTTGALQYAASSPLGPVAVWTCGQSFTVSHKGGSVAPVDKIVTYQTITYNSKCWITQNLGATRPASSFDDGSEDAAGWYWQYGKSQGYRYDASGIYPTSFSATGPYVKSDWTNDPCTQLLGSGWALPTYNALNAINTGTLYAPAIYAIAGLKIHMAGLITPTTGTISDRGLVGFLWSSTYASYSSSWIFTWDSISKYYGSSRSQDYGAPIRCYK